MHKKKILVVFIYLAVIAVAVLVSRKFTGLLPVLLPAKQANKPQSNSGDASSQMQPGNFTGIPLKIPNNIRIETFAKGLGKPRVLQTDINGNVIVSIPESGKVVRLTDSDKDGVSDKAEEIIIGLKNPHGLAFEYGDCAASSHNCILFVATENSVLSYDYRPEGKVTFMKKIADLPSGGNHTSRSLLFANGQLLVSVGSSCNVCVESDNRRAAVLAMNSDGSNQRIFASGLRNTVFMARNPFTGDVWGADMGRDRIGDDLPEEEINIIKENTNYGWPFCYGDGVQDKSFDSSDEALKKCKNSKNPHIKMQAHSAPLGLAFIPKSFGEFEGDLLVAFHGSWNRSVPTGFKIVKISLGKNGESEGIEDFISGWLPGTNAAQGYGRPVAIIFDIFGAAYISDDKAGVIYKVTHSNK